MNSPQTKLRNLLPKTFYYLFCITFFITSCSSDGGGGKVDIKSSEKQITSFSLSASSNADLDLDISGIINEDNKTISVVVPFGISITALLPNISISNEARISPSIDTTIDFSSPVIFTVTAEDDSIVDYTVNISNADNSEKRIIEFMFTQEANIFLAEEAVGSINEENKTIEVLVPFNTEVNSLVPTIVLSNDATSNPAMNATVDFTTPVSFEITAQDGSTVSYTVTVTKNGSDYDTLKALFDANPGNSLNWNFDNLDISTWEGVTAENDRAIALTLTGKGLTIIPAEIGDLQMLSFLYLQNNSIESIPSEIRNLAQSLTQLLLSNNPIKTVNSEIGALVNLEYLDLFNTDIVSLPVEIGDLTNLFSLNLGQNFDLASIPKEVGNLSNLNRLSLIGANYTIPTEIGNLSNLTFLNLSNCDLSTFPTQVLGLTKLNELYLSANTDITSVPSSIGGLTSLTKLFLDNNSITSLPEQIGMLTNLTTLNISGNPSLTTIPQAICDLENGGTVITKDSGTTCN